MVNRNLALLWASAGATVFPVNQWTKAPTTQKGHHDASSDPTTVSAMWTGRRADAAVGLPCRANGVIVLDGDRHAGGPDGVMQLEFILAQIRLDRQSHPIVATPGKGEHHYFRCPPDLGPTKGKPAPGVDVKDNGYVVAAGSVMGSGGVYRLVSGSVEELARAISNGTLPVLPPALAEFISQPAPRPTISPSLYADGAEARFTAILRKLASAREGERNNLLHWCACRVGEMVRDGQVDENFGIRALTLVAQHIGLPARAATKTIDSGVRRG